MPNRLIPADAAPQSPQPDPWQARWVWCHQATQGRHDFVDFRKAFQLNPNNHSAHLHVTAEREYELWVNGHFVGRGPVLSDPRFKRYDTYDVTQYLVEGNNCIAATVYHDCKVCRMTAHAEAHGFLCQLDIDAKPVVVSDETWFARRNEAWLNTNTTVDDVTWAECYDSQAIESDWRTIDFDDSCWPKAVGLIAEVNPLWGSPQPQARFFPWVNLIPSESSPLRYTRHRPTRILQCGEILQSRIVTRHDIAIRMSLETILPMEKASVENVEALTSSEGSAVIITNSPMDESHETFDGLRNVTIVLDFAKLMNARLGFRLDALPGAVVDIGYAYRMDNGHVVPYDSHRTCMASEYIAHEGLQQWQTFQWYHFRYVKLTFRELTRPLKLLEVWAEQVEHPFDQRGRFECDDTIINRVFHASRRTTELCTTDRTMDNPSRERKQYLGDCSGILNAIWSCFGDAAVARKYFLQTDEGQHSTGLYRYAYPGWDDDKASLFDHSLSVPLRLYEYDLCFDVPDLLDHMWPGLLRWMRLVESAITRDGILDSPPYAVWIDWAHVDRRGRSFVLNAMVCEALRRSAAIATRLGYDREAQRWSERTQTMCQMLQKNWFDQGRGVFVDAVVDQRLGQHVSEHALSLAVLFNIATAEQVVAMMETYSKDRDSFGQASPAWSYMPSGLIRGGRTDLALQWMHKRFGPLFEKGRETLPETWSLFGEDTTGVWRSRNSRAVAQGAGLSVPWTLLTELCGIKPLEPGFQSVHFSPQPGSLARMTGTFPGPDGDYTLYYQRQPKGDSGGDSGGGGCQIDIAVPGDRPVVLDLPFVDVDTPVFSGTTRMKPTKTIAMPNGQPAPRYHLVGKSQYHISVKNL